MGDAPGLRFVVHGKPAPKGSMESVGQHGRGWMKESNPNTEPWRKLVKDAAEAAMWKNLASVGSTLAVLEGPVAVTALFSFTKPVGAPKRRRIWPVTRATYDTDKLLRCVDDALQDAGAIKDDSQVVDIHGIKAYCGEFPSTMATPGAVITVRPLEQGEEHAQL